MSNILKAFVTIVNNNKINIDTLKSGNNRANNMGEGLENMKVLDLFSGCGGFSYGFQEAGFDIVLGIDNVKYL